jgi:hypothetical protein
MQSAVLYGFERCVLFFDEDPQCVDDRNDYDSPANTECKDTETGGEDDNKQVEPEMKG